MAKILVADAVPNSRRLLVNILSGADFEVIETTKKLSQNLNHKCIDRFLETRTETPILPKPSFS